MRGKMKFCVIGLGRFGYQLAETLAEQGMEVLGIDRNENIIASIRDKITQAICLDVVDEQSLQPLGLDDMDTVIVAMGEDFAQSILICALIKKHFPDLKVIARATNKIHEDILTLVGADKVVLPERDMGIKFAHQLSKPFLDIVNISDTFAVTQIAAPQSFVGKTVGELQLKKSRNIICIGIKKKGDDKIILANSDYVILEGDKLFLAGETQDLSNLMANI